MHDILRKIGGERGFPVDDAHLTYYLTRLHILATNAGQMNAVSETVYSYLQRNAVAVDQAFKIPPELIVEIGAQVDL